MSLTLSLITFSPNTTIKSADVNANFQQIANVTKFVGEHVCINNINVSIELDDFDIKVENNSRTVHTCRHRHGHDDSDDRGHCHSVKVGNIYIDSFVIDLGGQCHFIQAHPKDFFGNHMPSIHYFSGDGNGTYSHGFVCDSSDTPLTCLIQIDDSSGPTYHSIKNLGTSTVTVSMNSTRNFDGIAIFYDDDD